MLTGLIAIIKFVLFGIFVASYILFCFFWRLFNRDIRKRRQFYVRIIQRYSKMFMWFLNFEAVVKNKPDMRKHYLYVGNHLGMLDILLVASQLRCMFVTSYEMREMPLIGTLAEMGGCLFVERRNRMNIINETANIREALTQGFNVILFPEGTSTNGERVLPFKKTLMTAAAGSGTQIYPFVINYTKVNGEPLTLKWRDHVCWYGDQGFIGTMWKICTLKSLQAELQFLKPISVKDEKERTAVAAQAHEQVSSHFLPINTF